MGLALEDLDIKPEWSHRTPDVGMEDDEVASIQFEYSDRAPKDWVISGPLPDGAGPGRQFDSWEAASAWANDKYGARLKHAVLEAGIGNRWAFLIRGE